MNTKISQDAATALFNCTHFNSINTVVYDRIMDNETGQSTSAEMFLYGSCIAAYNRSTGALTISLCGQATATTKARLNAILASINGRVYTRKGTHFLDVYGETRALHPWEYVTLSLKDKDWTSVERKSYRVVQVQ